VNGSGSVLRHGEFFEREMTAFAPLAISVSAIASLSGSSVTNTGSILFPGTTQVFGYDADGNLTNDTIWAYQWDAENRLKSMTMTNVSGVANSNRFQLTFKYDWLGRRYSKTVAVWNGVDDFTPQSTTLFLYDGDGWNLIAELNGGVALDPLPLLRSYTWGLDITGDLEQAAGIGGLVMFTDHTSGPTYHFAAYDGNGNVTALVQSDGTPSARYEYSAFGEMIRQSGSFAKANAFRWSTKFWDEETGLSYYGSRYYKASAGRWIGRDPVEEEAGNNLYAFLGNNPLNSFDLLGTTTGSLVDLEAGSGGVAAAEGSSAPAVTIGQTIKDFIKGLEEVQSFMAGVEAAEDMLGGDITDWIDKIEILKKEATSNPLKSDHGHHLVPKAVQKEITAYEKQLIPKNKYLVKLAQKLHLSGLHGKAGGAYNKLMKEGSAKFGAQMKDPAFVIGFAAGAMRKLGLGDASFLQ
jgi:RHS repeat-associated protein